MQLPNLTPLERLTLANQYKILAGFGGKDAEQYANNAQVLIKGYVALYPQIFEMLSDELPTMIMKEVQDILDMFYGIQIVFQQRPQSEIDAAELDRSKLTFTGFDAEYDRYAELAHFMVSHEELYQELRGAQFYSSSRRNDMLRYRRMLPIYQAAFKSPEGLTVSTLKAMQEAV